MHCFEGEDYEYNSADYDYKIPPANQMPGGILFNIETKRSTRLRVDQPFPVQAAQPGQCSGDGNVFGLCSLNGNHEIESKAATAHLVVYNHGTGSIKSIFNVRVQETLAWIEKLGPFDYGPRLLPDGIALESRRKDLGQGYFYDGEWNANGQRHGIGQQFDSGNNFYDGHWFDDQMHGRGRKVLANRSIFEGNFKQNQYDGYGILKNAYGDLYKGEFQSGMKHGKGKDIQNSGDIFDGHFVKDQKHGFGTLMKSDGTMIYSG